MQQNNLFISFPYFLGFYRNRIFNSENFLLFASKLRISSFNCLEINLIRVLVRLIDKGSRVDEIGEGFG